MLPQVVATEPLHCQTVSQGIAPLATDGLALARGQGLKEIVKAPEAVIVPMKLRVDALQPTVSLDFVGFA
jgi:hypothetical protein